MSLKLLAGQVPLLKYQRSTAALISALFWLLAFVFAVELETEILGITTTAMMPRIVTTAKSSSSENPRRRLMFLPWRTGFILHLQLTDCGLCDQNVVH